MSAVAESAVEQYKREGYTIVRGLFTPEETAFYRDHYMHLRETGSYEGDFGGVDPTSADPLKRYPRMIHMHRWDDISLRWMCEPRLARIMTDLCDGVEPYGVQTMLYFKPAGARGQALHQDQFYLRALPGCCLAAWMALDDCDEENGCLQVVPGSQEWPLLCTVKADTTQSFTDVTVPVPDDKPIIPCVMKAGDVLFFHGLLVHGSFPNHSADRFRRALIGHYLTGDAQTVGQWYHPVFRMDRTIIDLGTSPDSMPCGTWVDDGSIAMQVETLPDLHE